jgi:competence protein ComEC
MPVVSAWVMPMGILGVIAMPFGFDAQCWRLMGYGIEWMDTVALWVASLPGAFGRVTAFGAGPLLVLTAALLVIGLLKTPLRWSGVIMAAAAIVWMLNVPAPDVLIGNDGRSFAVRGADGRFAFHHAGGDTFAIREWLAADADGRDVKDHGLMQGIACDPFGCTGRLADGTRVAYASTPDAFADDCREAGLVIAARVAPPPGCAAMVIDRNMWRARGALALRRTASGFEVDAVRGASLDRPWSPAWSPAHGQLRTPAAGTNAAPPDVRIPPRDATPQPEDIEADR